MDWNNVAHVMQLMLMAMAFFAFAHGYSVGVRST